MSRHLYTAIYRETRTAAAYNQSGVLTSTSIKRCGAISGSSLPRLWTRSLQLDRPTYAPASRTLAFTPQCSPAATHYF